MRLKALVPLDKQQPAYQPTCRSANSNNNIVLSNNLDEGSNARDIGVDMMAGSEEEEEKEEHNEEEEHEEQRAGSGSDVRRSRSCSSLDPVSATTRTSSSRRHTHLLAGAIRAKRLRSDGLGGQLPLLYGQLQVHHAGQSYSNLALVRRNEK